MLVFVAGPYIISMLLFYIKQLDMPLIPRDVMLRSACAQIRRRVIVDWSGFSPLASGDGVFLVDDYNL